MGVVRGDLSSVAKRTACGSKCSSRLVLTPAACSAFAGSLLTRLGTAEKPYVSMRAKRRAANDCFNWRTGARSTLARKPQQSSPRAWTSSSTSLNNPPIVSKCNFQMPLDGWGSECTNKCCTTYLFWISSRRLLLIQPEEPVGEFTEINVAAPILVDGSHHRQLRPLTYPRPAAST